jgi:CRP-like cAMP-binding protein
MVSIQVLRRYPFFSLLTSEQLKSFAAIADEIHIRDGEIIFEEGEPAHALYFLLEGCVELFYTIQDAYLSEDRVQVTVGRIDSGEPFGISTLIEPYTLTSTARGCGPARVLKIEADKLHTLLREDRALEILMLRKMSHAALERLHATRTQLAVAWA